MRDEKNKRFGKGLLAITLALVLLLTSVAGAVEVFAEEGFKTIDFANGIVVEKPEPKAPITEDAKAKDEKAGSAIEKDAKEEEAELEIGDELFGAPVGATVNKPTIKKAELGEKTISGGGLVGSGQRKAKNADCKIHVTVKRKAGGVEKKTDTIAPKGGSSWSVTLDNALEAGDVITAQQEFDGNFSEEAKYTVKETLNITHKDTIKMPEGEIWIEQYVANIVNADETAEALDLLKKANPTIADDIESVEFKITGIDPNKIASYIVTYTDNSKTGEIQATGLTIKQVTDTSRGADLDKITIVDNVIKGKLLGEGPFNGIKVQLILNVKKEKSGDFCTDKGCKIDKDSSNPIEVNVQSDGTFYYTLQERESLTLDQIVGISVKEPHKFVSCSTTTVKPVIPEKTEVRDPRKLTSKDKEAIDAAIRKAYTAKDGKSKLPNGTGNWDGVPAVIQFDDSGNVKIFSGNDVAGTWDPNNGFKFVPEKNEDGSYKLKDGAQPTITIPGKDLLKNIKPDAPTPALSKDKKNITITPNEKDTDAEKIIVTYKDKNNKDKTITAIKSLVNEKPEWKIDGVEDKSDIKVNENGVVTFPTSIIKGGTDVTATVTDKGGIADDDKTPLTSDAGTLHVEETKADKVKALGGLDPVVMKKWVKDKLDWKDGVKAKDSRKETEVNNLLAGATFDDFQDDASKAKRNTDEANNTTGFVGKIKVTFSDGSELVVENQTLYVSDHVTWFSREEKPGGNVVLNENTPDDALVVEFKLGEGTIVEDKDPNTGKVTKTTKGDKDDPVSYQKYKVKPNTDLKTYENKTLHVTYYNLINSKVKAIDKYTEPVWYGENGLVAENFIITESNNVFTATATKTYDITFDANTGGGTKDKVTQKVNTEYELPSKDTFTPPNENQEFSGWQIGDDSTNLKEPGAKIIITGDTVVKAIWKPIELKVNFLPGTGATGEMKDVPVNKGSDYKLPEPTFTPPKNQKFAGWKVGNEDGVKKAGDTIKIAGNVTLTATWKPIMVDVSFDKGEGSGNKDKVTVAKGSEYTLPNSDGFTPPAGKEFAGWQVGKETKKVGDKITVNENTVVKALWKAKAQPGKDTGNKEERSTFLYFKSTTKPVLNLKDHSQYMIGYKDGTFRPNNKMSRQEVTVMLSRLLSERPQKGMIYSRDYKDVADNLWSVTAISYMSNLKLVKGYPDGTFRPTANITRAEFAAMVVRFENISTAGSKTFTDLQKDHWAYEVIQKAAQAGWISGYPDGSFKPDQPISRAEVVTITNRMLNRFADEDFVDHNLDKIINFTDIDKSHWAYYPVVEATNGHRYERKGNGKDETWFEVTGSTFVYDK